MNEIQNKGKEDILNSKEYFAINNNHDINKHNIDISQNIDNLKMKKKPKNNDKNQKINNTYNDISHSSYNINNNIFKFLKSFFNKDILKNKWFYLIICLILLVIILPIVLKFVLKERSKTRKYFFKKIYYKYKGKNSNSIFIKIFSKFCYYHRREYFFIYYFY